MARPTQVVLYPLKLGHAGRHLVDQGNQPFFLAGDTAWSLVVQGTKAEIDHYLGNREQKGFNAVLVNLIEHKFGSHAPRNIYGAVPFTGANFITPNEEYFAHADHAIKAAAAHGIVVLLSPLYLGHGCGDEGWCAEVKAASTAQLQSWGHYLGTRYRNFDNLIWVIGGDVDPTAGGVRAKVDAFAASLTAADPRHLVSAHNDRGQMAVDPWPTAGWLTLNSTYTSFDGTAAGARAAHEHPRGLPFFQIEAYYENERGMSQQQLRAQAYWSLLGGGTGYVFGNCPVWGLGRPAVKFCPAASMDWKAQLDSPGSVSSALVQSLFRSWAWQDLVPDWDHTTITAGYGTMRNADHVGAGRAEDGSLVLAYLPSVGTVSVDMGRLRDPVRASWYDPSSGSCAAISGSPLPNSGTRRFTPPGNNRSGAGDWVLVLDAGRPPEPAARHGIDSLAGRRYLDLVLLESHDLAVQTR